MSDEPASRGLSHVELYVSDLARSTAFWGWLLPRLGFEPFQDWPGGRSWRCGPTYLVFVQTADEHLEPAYHRCRTGLNHLAFHARDAAQVDALRDEMRERGIPLLYDERYPHAGGPDVYAVFCEDPDRIKVEIVAGVRT